MGVGVAVVIGAGDYIGSAIAERFAKGGYQIVAARRNKSGDKLEPLQQSIESMEGVCHPMTMDARDEEQVKALFEKTERDIGAIDVCVFNVGGNVHFPIAETTTRVFYKVWEMACFAGFLTGREAAKYMVPRERGCIFFTGATASVRGASGYAAFASAKSGLRALAQSMARELGPKNIHVSHLVVDAGVDTEWVRNLMRESMGEAFDQLPPDTLMTPSSIADVYWFLHQQPRDAWTFELDLRPFAEKF